MIDDGFKRTVQVIDRELKDQVSKRDDGLTEILHGLFVVERATGIIDRLIEERLRVEPAKPAKTDAPLAY